MARDIDSRTRIESPRPDAAPNLINQDGVGFMFQDLKLSDPRVWQAITSLRAIPAPASFYAEIILPGKQTVGEDVLDHPCILRFPVDPYRMWKVQSVLLHDVAIVCKTMPEINDYAVDILISRNRRQDFTSIFLSTSYLPRIKVNGNYYVKLGHKDLGTTELFSDDEFRIDVVQADDFVEDCWLVVRGVANLLRDKPENP